MGQRAQARAALGKSLQLSKGKQVSSGAIALTYAALGDKDESFQWLEGVHREILFHDFAQILDSF
jgi:hypothetical protein